MINVGKYTIHGSFGLYIHQKMVDLPKIYFKLPGKQGWEDGGVKGGRKLYNPHKWPAENK